MSRKKELGKDSMGIQKTMRFTDYLGDGLGQLPLNIMANLVGQLTYFYTDKVGLAAGMVATMLLIAKIVDAFSDLIMGKIMDMGNSPKGKCRPWFLRMAIPAAVIIIMIFTVPKSAPTVPLWRFVRRVWKNVEKWVLFVPYSVISSVWSSPFC